MYRVDGEQGQVGFFLCMVDEVDVHELLDFYIGRGDIFDDRREVWECLLATIHHLQAEELATVGLCLETLKNAQI
jgi:hypothetical protein